MKLLIVESPNKIKKLSEILGTGWDIAYTAGHIEDLPERGIGVDVFNDFSLRFEFRKDRADIIQSIREKASKASDIFIATDPDREGEAIAYSITKILPPNKKAKRVVFNAITPSVVKQAIENARDINYSLVASQHCRRAIDRLIGYVLSPLATAALNKNLSNNKFYYSVGRVQSAILAIINDRTLQVCNFIPKEYYTLYANYDVFGSVGASSIHLKAKAKAKFKNHTVANAARLAVSGRPHIVKSVIRKKIQVSPPSPLVTSSLQIESGKRFGMSSTQTINIAQKLFAKGFLTYPRTDSPFVSKEARQMVERYIRENWGDRYYEPRYFKAKTAFAQESHECIRPVKLFKNTDWMYEDWRNIYELSKKYLISAFMPDAVIEEISYRIDAGNNIEFESKGQRLVFDGFYKVMDKPDFQYIPDYITEGTKLYHYEVFSKKESTPSPERYDEPSIVKEMAENGIGRPSTYASTIDTLKKKGYIKPLKSDNTDNNVFESSKQGMELVTYLKENYPWVVDKKFTANMESMLDDVANGKIDYKVPVEQTWRKLQETIPDLKTLDIETLDIMDMSTPTL